MKRSITILSVTFILALAFMMFFSWLGNPLRGCNQFYTGTQYQGYQCGQTTEYVQ